MRKQIHSDASRLRPTLGLLVGLFIGSALVGGCLYQADNPCGEGQVFEDDLCRCEEGSVLVAGKCIACGPDEEATAEGCLAAIEGLGQACTSSDDCFPDGADTCVDDEGDSYCTLPGCSSSEDCPMTFACDLDATEPVCIKGPSGFGKECEDSAECAGQEAAYCETLQEKICMLECTADPGSCPSDWSCCDLSDFIGVALCIPPSNLEDGACPLGADTLEESP